MGGEVAQRDRRAVVDGDEALRVAVRVLPVEHAGDVHPPGLRRSPAIEAGRGAAEGEERVARGHVARDAHEERQRRKAAGELVEVLTAVDAAEDRSWDRAEEDVRNLRGALGMRPAAHRHPHAVSAHHLVEGGAVSGAEP